MTVLLPALGALYAVLISIVILFQCALIAGAPWGHLTQGGRFQGRLPMSGRIAAVASILLLVLMMLAMLSAAGVWLDWPRWTGWLATAVTALSTLANLATPSRAERRLWGPVTVLMLICAVGIMLF